MNEPVAFLDIDTYKNRCEDEAPSFVDAKFCSPIWAKNIRGEYANMLFDVCDKNTNRDSGIFSVDGVDMDLASQIAKFMQKHPHIDYVCPIPWRTKVLGIIKTNFTEACNNIRQQKTILGEDDEEIIPQENINPNQPIAQTMHDVSNRVWSAWRIVSDLASNQLVAKFNAGEVEEKNFQNAIRVRDTLKKLAADIDDLALAFQIIKKKEEEDNDEE